MKWIDSGDIKNWAKSKQRHCSQVMPELVRRLILSTAEHVEECEFPSGDSIALGGWDGRLKTNSMSPFFPSGFSGWEISAEKRPGVKAEADYSKRSDDPLDLIPEETTFVFVTPHAWAQSNEWKKEKRLERRWKDIFVINADGLEQWLDSAPAVALWLAKLIGKVNSDGIHDLESFWEEWSTGTKPVMTTDLVIGGRTKDVEEINKWINGMPAIKEVQGDHPTEPFIFLFAAISNLPDHDKSKALARCIVINDLREFRQVIQAFQESPLIISVSGECLSAAPATVAKGHHVLISVDSNVTSKGEFMRLSRPMYRVIEEVLHKEGVSNQDSKKIARDYGRSLPVLHRYLFDSKVVNSPNWVTPEIANLLFPTLLLGAWDEKKEGDCDLISTLSGMSPDDYKAKIHNLLSVDDAPIRKVGTVWMLKSQLDAWFLLSKYLTASVLEPFKKIATAAFTFTNPRYNLPEDKQWASDLYGKSNPFSGWMQNGLADSLIMLAVFGDRSTSVNSTQTFVNGIISQIFDNATTWKEWASLNRITPLLAEAAPTVFLSSLESMIENNPSQLKKLFHDNGDMFGECKHSGLLWALESLAWNPEYFHQTSLVLLGFADIDQGGRLRNRPINSLKSIFQPRYPQTHALPEQRINTLTKMIEINPNLVWKFCVSYFSGNSMFMESHRFRWRDQGGNRGGFNPEDTNMHNQYLSGFLPLLKDLACVSENLIQTAKEIHRLPDEFQTHFIETLKEKLDKENLTSVDQNDLRDAIRMSLHWVNRTDEVKRQNAEELCEILERLSPTDIIKRYSWLLETPFPKLPEGDSGDFEKNNSRINVEQERAAREILDESDVTNILDFASTVQYQEHLGFTFGRMVHDGDEDSLVLNAMITRYEQLPFFIKGYSAGRVSKTSVPWVSNQVTRLKSENRYTPEICALLYLGLPENRTTWIEIEEQGKDVESAYWKYASGFSRTDRKESASYAVEKLLDAERPSEALFIASEPHITISCNLLVRLIREIILCSKEEDNNLHRTYSIYQIGCVFKKLYECNELSDEELVGLEWPFASIFDEIQCQTKAPLAIHRELTRNPVLFSQLISFVYKREDKQPDPMESEMDEEKLSRIANNAYQVLKSWSLIPGTGEDGEIDEDSLLLWIENTRDECAKANRIIAGDMHIGIMLSHSPSDKDGTFPHIAIRNLLEKRRNDIIERHFEIGILNSRGVVSRGWGEGGVQERELSKRFRNMGSSLNPKWPRTARILISIADHYDWQAKHEDIDTDLHDLLCD